MTAGLKPSIEPLIPNNVPCRPFPTIKSNIPSKRAQAFCKIDIIVHLRTTTPFRKIKLIDKAIGIFLKNKKYSCLRSFVASKKTPFKMYFKKKNSAVPVISSKKELHSMGRQYLPKTFQHSGYIDILRIRDTIEKKSMVGKKIFFYFIKDKKASIDIDSKKDLLSIQN